VAPSSVSVVIEPRPAIVWNGMTKSQVSSGPTPSPALHGGRGGDQVVAVGDQHALGRRGGARGVDEHRDVVLVDLGVRLGVGLRGQLGVEVGAQQQRVRHELGERRVGEHDGRLGVRELPRRLVGPEHRVDHRERRRRA
jgi:hypothetical protein